MKKILRVVAIALAVCIIALLLRGYLPPRLMKNATYGLTALSQKGHVSNLYIGSSMFGKGLNPQLLDEDSWILAYNGTQPVLIAWMLDELLSRGLTIDTLYVDLYAYSAAAEPALSDNRIFLDLTPDKTASLIRSVYGSNASLPVWWEALVSANNESLLTWPVYSRLVNANYLNGGRLQDFEGSTKAALQQAGVYGISEEIHPAQEAAWRHIAETAQRNGIRLFWVETPKYCLTMENKGYRAVMDKLNALAESCGVTVLSDFPGISDDPACFIDAIHLSAKGRDLFTSSLVSR